MVDVTAKWCITCKYNQFVVWDTKRTVELLHTPHIVAMRLDVTNYDKSAEKYILSNGVYGVPLNIVYGPTARQGIVLPTLVTYENLAEAIEKASTKNHAKPQPLLR